MRGDGVCEFGGCGCDVLCVRDVGFNFEYCVCGV